MLRRLRLQPCPICLKPLHARITESHGRLFFSQMHRQTFKGEGSDCPAANVKQTGQHQHLFKQAVRSRSFADLMLMIKSFINGGHLEQAEALLAMVKLTHMSEWWKSNDSALLNMFVQAYLASSEPARAFDHLRSQSKSRNSLTFLLLLKHYLGEGLVEKCKDVIREMQMSGIIVNQTLWTHFVETKVLTLTEWDKLRPIVGASMVAEPISLVEIPVQKESPTIAMPIVDSEKEIEDIRSIQSNSNGIQYVKNSLQALRDLSCSVSTIDKYELQERLERDCVQSASDQLQQEMMKFAEISGSPNVSKVKGILCKWHPILTNHFKDLIGNATNFTKPEAAVPNNESILYAALLSSLQAEKISIIAMQEMTRISGWDANLDGIPLTRLAVNIGACLEREIFAQQVFRKDFLAHIRLSPHQRAQVLHDRKAFSKFMAKTRAVLDDNIEARQAGWIPAWSSSLRAEIGVFIVSEGIKLLQLPTSEASPSYLSGREMAFKHELASFEKKRYGVIKLHPKLYELLSSETSPFLSEAWAMPMVVPPSPWITYNQGGYLTLKNICVRLKDDPVHLSILHEANANGKMDKVLHGLDILGQTAWAINERILHVAVEEWNSGINVSTHFKPPTERTYEYKPAESFSDRKEYAKYVGEWFSYLQEKEKAHSTMCDTNYKLEIARQFVGIPFYLPHSVDFRGRAYPIPPHLNHVGSDLSRGLLIFAEAKPLGSRGLYWLKVQLANMFGYDKASLDDRVAFVDSHLENVLDSAKNPLGGKRWWKQADEPWQCLAACMELEAVLQAPNPEEYFSSFPVQQDGSCNGLQHYAALGRDVNGAAKVNLSPSSSPQDIYAAVANLVNKTIEEDCVKGSQLALKLQGKINRKIIKQPVMTNVYGVTPYGARAQIQERLKEHNVVAKEDYLDARKYLCNLVFASLRTLFVKARLIQDWLANTAMEISRALPVETALKYGYRPELEVPIGIQGEKHRTPNLISDVEFDVSLRYPQTPVSWDTPLGFRVVQPYLKTRTIHLKTVIQNVSLKSTSQFDPVDVAKQVSAFPPNFIHSLDATHMFLTAMACFKANVVFASVHDCFWTHAASVDAMNRHIREQFVVLYEQPILKALRDDFLRNYGQYKVPIKIPADLADPHPDDKPEKGDQPDPTDGQPKHVSRWRPIHLPPVPEQGGFDIKQVLQSQYFFS